MATDTWFLFDTSKIDGADSNLHIQHGRDRLVISLGGDDGEVRRNVERFRKALAQIITDKGGE